MPKAAPAGFSRAQALLSSFETNGRINHYMIENLPTESWRAAPPGRDGRTTAAVRAHLDNVRVRWLKAAAKESRIAGQRDRTRGTPAQVEALEQSQTALRAVLKSALASDGRRKGFRPDVAGFFGYLIAHDRHHRGQTSMLALWTPCRKRRCSARGSGAPKGNGSPGLV
jgi:uncharacterized damage-inducible protein DinB